MIKRRYRPHGRHDGRVSNLTGFSLVELLVVIGIIAVLIAILLPALSVSRESAQRLKCLATLRGISEAAQLHVNQHQGYLPLAGHHWDLVNDRLDPQGVGDDGAVRYTYYMDNGTLRPVPVTAALAMAMGTDIRTDSRPNLEEDLTRRDLIALFHCPSQTEARRGLSQRGPGWSAPLECSSYVFNEAVLGRREHFAGRTEAIQGNLAKVRHASQVFLAADGLPRGGTDGDVIVISNVDDHDTLATFVESDAWGPEVARGHMDYQRHGYRMNVLFLDAHAETIYMTDDYLRTIGVSEGIYD